MTAQAKLDPAVEAVMSEVIESRARAIGGARPELVVRGAHDAVSVWTSGTTGLVPVERHLAGVLRSEFVQLCLDAVRESLLDDPTRHFLWAGRRSSGLEWRARWQSAVATRDGLTELVQREDPRLLLPRPALKDVAPLLRADFLGLALRLEASTRVRFWVSCHHIACEDWTAAAGLARRLIEEPSPPLYRKHAYDVLGSAAASLGRTSEACDAYRCGLAEAESLGELETDIAVSAFSLACVSLLLQDARSLDIAAGAVRGLMAPGVDTLLDQQVDLVRKARENGTNVPHGALDWARGRKEAEEPRVRRLFDAFA